MSNRFFPNYPDYHVTSPFGPRWSSYHYGIDLVAKTKDGGTAVDYIMAHTGGVVEECGFNASAGNFVRIRVSDDTVMSYCHFRNKLPWKLGDKIDAGTVLGYMGSTGNSTGDHLHWGIKRDGVWIDPAPYLDADYTEDESAPAPQKPEVQTCTVTLPFLRRGDTGDKVALLQLLLDHHGYPCGNAGSDGIFGPDTETALKYFQAEKDMDPDAICGSLTWPEVLKA